MIGPRPVSLTMLGGLLAFAVGCSSTSTPELTNPFTTADRVPPPALQTAPSGVAPPYYPQAAQGQATFAPAAPGVAPAYQGAPAASPYQAAPAYTPAPAQAPAPGSATPFYGAPPVGGPTASNEVPIVVPTDAASLRFASPTAVAQARQQSQPIGRTSPTYVASNTSAARPPATANAWVSGSAPVRAATPAASPRVRVPGESGYREPVSLAALDGGVSIAPLEPVPGAPPAGGAAPLRVATPPSGTVWR